MRLVLASASPQRRAALERLGVSFEVQPSGASELEHGVPEEVAVENALRKARAVRAARGVEPGEAVLGVDTLVTLDGVIYGKPADAAQARATLRALSGATHRVLSGVALLFEHEERTALALTEVRFRELDETLLEWYVRQQEWRERSGGYAIQKGGSLLVREVRGDYENVVGLPLATLLDLHPALLAALH
ncbi:MAG TPA: Maf family nucleotide pyrophosphatase [Solirubrobacteraceae bacterium]|nr:Maf family nucleotide pyrophosphatase [Solirubrobacteraceae bacterium]